MALAGLVVAAGVAGGCPGRPGGSDETVLATYASGEVTRRELNLYLTSRGEAGDSAPKRSRGWQEVALRSLALEELAAREAPTDPELIAQLEETTRSLLEEAMRRELGWAELTVTVDEARQFYDENRSRFVEPEKIRLQHIFLRAEADGLTAEEREVVRVRLDALRQRIVGGEDFESVARRYSESADAARGGWMVLKKGAPAVRSFTEVVWGLEENEVSPPIDTPSGFHLARLATWFAPIERPFEEVEERATAEALEIALRRVEREYLEAKAVEHEFQRNYEELADMSAESESVLYALGSQTLTLGELLDSLPLVYRQHFHAGHLSDLVRILDEHALSRILVLEARALGVDEHQDVVARIERDAQSIRAQYRIDRLLAERVADVPEEELREFFRRGRRRFASPRLRSLSLMRLPRSPNGSLWTTLRRGERLVQEIRAGADFAELARRESRHPSARSGGRLVDQTDEDLREHVQAWAPSRQILEALEPGEVSRAFVGEIHDPRTQRFEPAGVYVIRLDDETPARQVTFEEAREQVEAAYLRRHDSRMRAELKREMLSEAGFRLSEAGLERAARS